MLNESLKVWGCPLSLPSDEGVKRNIFLKRWSQGGDAGAVPKSEALLVFRVCQWVAIGEVTEAGA